jgi:hypothetical protein
MSDSSRTDDAWAFQRPIGTLHVGAFAARVDVTRPELGLQQARFGSASVEGQLLCVAPSGTSAWPARVADAYVRGHDLVATYEPTADWPYAPQIYWRAEPMAQRGGPLASLSLQASIQTHLLDTHPQVDVLTALPADELLHVAPAGRDGVSAEAVTTGSRVIAPISNVSCLLWRLPGGQLSYAEIMPASDFRQLSVQRDSSGAWRSRWELFAEFLEKGVIWRARVQMAWLPRENDAQQAAACCRAIEKRPLPLTT